MTRLERWVEKFKKLTPEKQEFELFRVRRDSLKPNPSDTMHYSGDLSFVSAESVDESTMNVEMVAKVRELVSFIRTRFGPRCAAAARAVMSGCSTAREVGAKMGITRQAADAHLARIRSVDVRKKSLELGLVSEKTLSRSMQMTA